MLLSNFTLNGTMSNLRHGVSGGNKSKDSKDSVILNIKDTFDFLYGVDFKNWHFKKFISKLSFINDGRNDQEKTFFYCDPPYLETADNYKNSFKESDSIDLFEALQKTG